MDNAIEEEPQRHPSTIYEPDLSPDPIITVKSQPLPSFGLDQDLSNLDVKLIDTEVVRIPLRFSAGFSSLPSLLERFHESK